VTGLILLVIAAVMLVPRFDAAGMPLALACSEWGMAALGWTLVNRSGQTLRQAHEHVFRRNP